MIECVIRCASDLSLMTGSTTMMVATEVKIKAEIPNSDSWRCRFFVDSQSALQDDALSSPTIELSSVSSQEQHTFVAILSSEANSVPCPSNGFPSHLRLTVT